jgi:hypothetical protein
VPRLVPKASHPCFEAASPAESSVSETEPCASCAYQVVVEPTRRLIRPPAPKVECAARFPEESSSQTTSVPSYRK